MLAGRVKLKHFLLVTGVVSFLVCGGLFVSGGTLLGTLASRPTPAPLPAPTPAPVADAAPAPAPGPASAVPVEAAAAPAGGRAVDTVVLGYQGKNLGTDKLKDVTAGKPYKVNVYQDAGQATANRAKIDLDRDDKWDEKVTFKPGEITRDVAPADDENYSEHYLWNGTAWTPS